MKLLTITLTIALYFLPAHALDTSMDDDGNRGDRQPSPSTYESAFIETRRSFDASTTQRERRMLRRDQRARSGYEDTIRRDQSPKVEQRRPWQLDDSGTQE